MVCASKRFESHGRTEVKFRVTMKDPDTMHDAVADAVSEDVRSIADEDERVSVKEVRNDKIRKLCSKWFKYGEYLTVEIDTDAGTCTVVPVHD
jgi:hypothetical protein